MKKTMLKFCLSGLGILGFLAMKEFAPTSISGKITPMGAADAVWAIKETDTVKTTVGPEGAFQVEVSPETWKLLVSAIAPYKNASVDKVEVTADKNTDVGEIKLEK